MPASMRLTDEAYRLKLDFSKENPAPIAGMHAARRDTAAFQVLVQSDRPYSLSVGQQYWLTARRRKGGLQEHLRLKVRAPFQVKLHLEEFVTDDDDIQKADMLLNQEVRESHANLPSAVWAEIEIPAEAEPGTYEVEVSLYGSEDLTDERLIDRQTLVLTVADVLLPAPAEWKFRLDLWQHSSNIARKHDVRLWSDEHFAVLAKYVRTLADLGQKSITVIASEVPWMGQSCRDGISYGGNMFEYSMIGITRDVQGEYHFDYSIMQRYIDLCTEAGISGDIEVIGLVNIWLEKRYDEKAPCPDFIEPLRLRYLDEADGCIRFVRDKEVIHDYIRSLQNYFIRTEQIGRVRIAADEPGDIEKYRESLAVLKELAPHFRCKTAINHAEFIEEFHDRIDDFSPFLRCAVLEYERLRTYQQQYPDKTFLWYVCCGDTIPNTFIRSPLLESRMIGILTSLLRFDGFLRWAYTIWPDDPRREARYGHFEAGDTHFVYPAYNGDVLLSLRWKNLRRGITDFELLETLRSRKGDQAVEAILARVLRTQNVADFWREAGKFTSKELFSLSWQDYDEAKAALLRALEEK